MRKSGRFWTWVRTGGAILGAALLLAGCGGTPLSPAGGSTATTGAAAGPEVLVVRPDGSVAFVPVGAAGALPAGSVASSDRSLTVSQEVDGSVGGLVECGRFVLHVPAGAFDGKGTVSMAMRDSTVMVVDLAISPADLNGFKEPVSLAVNATGADVSVDSLSLYWYDPEKSDWVGLACDKDLSTEPGLLQGIEDLAGSLLGTTEDTTRGLWTPLSHFSRYSAGKAGW